MNEVGDVIYMTASEASRFLTVDNDEMTRNSVPLVVIEALRDDGLVVLTAEHRRTGARVRIFCQTKPSVGNRLG